MKHLDLTFKVIVVIMLIGFMYLYYQSTQNHRYQYKFNNEGKMPVEIFDSKTGTLYIYHMDERSTWIKFSPLVDTEMLDSELKDIKK